MTAPAGLAVEAIGLVRHFGGHLALDHVTLAVARGGVHAVVGRNGAGKSTLYRVLLGFLGSSGGTSRLLGHDSATLPPEARGRIGYVDERHALPGWLRVEEVTALQRRHAARWDEATFRDVAASFRLPAGRRVSQLSRGERAGLALALAVAPQPELLLLDEPTLGLDVVASRAFRESLLFAGGRELGTVVYSTHDMGEVERLADRLIVLDRGAVVAATTPDELRARIGGWAIAEWPAERPLAAIPGVLDARRIDGEVHAVVLDGGDGFTTRVERLGGRGVAPLPLGFERAMDAFLRAGGRIGSAGGEEGA
jgi:ABC-2 type transport system ATP-binding protein